MLCVIRPDGKEDLKLIDFGMARVLEPGKTVKVACGTPEFVGESASCKIKDPFSSPEKCENAVQLFLRLDLPFTLVHPENGTSRKCSSTR